MSAEKKIFIDAQNSVLGRLASFAAKKALQGEQVAVVNAEKAIITGSSDYAMQRLKVKIDLHSKGNPTKGPKHSRMPDKVLRRAIRGMLPFEKKRGREAFKRVQVFISIPAEMQGKQFTKLDVAAHSAKHRYVELGTICRLLGAKW
jgi:large subunit ribosomal protein L13